jgi:hypothetical protein
MTECSGLRFADNEIRKKNNVVQKQSELLEKENRLWVIKCEKHEKVSYIYIRV